ncbi:pyridoxamine 5'-phosphate oxidase family protein [Cyclonatronum proteinivorum]|nr:pyridoxamine 5'-phosphate oxidase family protein [Cyclonatronum proteinivorum]
MIEVRRSLDQNLSELFGYLKRATADTRSPFRQPVLTTVDDNGTPHSRMLVLREINAPQHLIFFTDARTPKVAQLRQNRMASLLFWDPRKRVQLSMQVAVHMVEDDARLASYRDRVRGRAQQSYTTVLPPGTQVQKPEDAETWTDFESDNHFMVLECRPVSLTVLQLSGERHLRFVAEKKGDVWDASWVVP